MWVESRRSTADFATEWGLRTKGRADDHITYLVSAMASLSSALLNAYYGLQLQ